MDIVPERSVFLNVPYDAAFAPLFDAIVFATVCCGFVPRSALETGTVSEPRMDRILKALFTSKYSIHDLSRCTGEGAEQLARFNMPLELGIAMARRYMGKRPKQRHDWFVLVPTGHKYLHFISDLGAFDLATHDGTAAIVVPKVMSWLAGRPDAIRTPTPRDVLAALPAFQTAKKDLEGDWGGAVQWTQGLETAARRAPKL